MNMVYRIYENVQNLRASCEIYHESSEKLKSWTKIRGTNFNSGKNLKYYLPGKYIIASNTCYNNDIIELNDVHKWY